MNELEQYLETIESYAMVEEWDAEAYDEAVHLFLHNRFGGLFEQLSRTVPDIKGLDL